MCGGVGVGVIGGRGISAHPAVGDLTDVDALRGPVVVHGTASNGEQNHTRELELCLPMPRQNLVT